MGLQWLHDKPSKAVDAWSDLGEGDVSREDGTVHAETLS